MEPSEELVAVLHRRLRQAMAEAEHAVERSQVLAAARRLVREQELLKRCSWCGRISLGRSWHPVDELPGFVPEQVRGRSTHGICPGCFDEVERELAARRSR